MLLLLLLWSEVKKRVWEKDKTKSTTLLSFQLNSTQLNTLPLLPNSLTHSLTHSLKQTDRQTKKERLVLLCNKDKDICIALQQTLFFLSSQHSSISLQQAHFHCFSKSTTSLSSQLNATQLKHLYSFPTKTHVLSDWDADWDWDAESQSPLLLKQTEKQTERQSNKGEREMQRWR